MSQPGTPEEIEAEMAVQRERLVGTIDALTARLDVKSRARVRAAEVRREAARKVTAAKEQARAVTESARRQARTRTIEARERARTGAALAKEQATDETGRPRAEVLVAGAAVVVAVVLWIRGR